MFYTVDFVCNGFVCNVNSPITLHFVGSRWHLLHALQFAYNVNSAITFFMQSPRSAVTGKFFSYLACSLKGLTFLACCVLPDKKLYRNCLYWLSIPYWKFHLALKNTVCRENFYCIEYIFNLSGILGNLRLPWKTELPWKFSLYWNIFYHSGFLSNLRLSWKQSLPWIHCTEYISFTMQDFWETCACPEKHKLPRNFSLY